jgi:hypothetical protein
MSGIMSANAKPFVPKSKYNPNAKPYYPAGEEPVEYKVGQSYPNLPNVKATNMTTLNKPFDPATNVSDFAKANPEVWKKEVETGIMRSPLPNLKKNLLHLPNLTKPLGEPWTSMATTEGGRRRRKSQRVRSSSRGVKGKTHSRRSGAARSRAARRRRSHRK